MAERYVAMQGTETKWDALRRIVTQEVTDYGEAAAEYGRRIYASIDVDGQAVPGLNRNTAKSAAAECILRYMDELERQEHPEPGLTEPERFQVGEARHALVTFACTRDATSYSTERTLADHVGALLDIIDRLASQGGGNG